MLHVLLISCLEFIILRKQWEKQNYRVPTPKFCSYLLLSFDHSNDANCQAPVLPPPTQSQHPLKCPSKAVAYFKLLSWHLQSRTSDRYETSASMTKPTIPTDFNMLFVTYYGYAVPCITLLHFLL
jgi:hypothetical protein